MQDAFEDAMVTGWEQVCAGLDLPDPDDRHVLAAAITGGGQSLVTFNLKDFPDSRLLASGVEAVHPDEFLLDQLDLHPAAAMQVLSEQAADLRHPPSTSSHFSTCWSGVVSRRLPTRHASSCDRHVAAVCCPFSGKGLAS
jgi:hypothetical protein